MTTKNGKRAATLAAIHWVVAGERSLPASFPGCELADAVIQMAIRYGAAISLQSGPGMDYELTSRARERRFTALQRLVGALRRQS